MTHIDFSLISWTGVECCGPFLRAAWVQFKACHMVRKKDSSSDMATATVQQQQQQQGVLQPL